MCRRADGRLERGVRDEGVRAPYLDARGQKRELRAELGRALGACSRPVREERRERRDGGTVRDKKRENEKIRLMEVG